MNGKQGTLLIALVKFTSPFRILVNTSNFYTSTDYQKLSPLFKIDVEKQTKTQGISVKKIGKCIVGFKFTFGEHLENIAVYTRKMK